MTRDTSLVEHLKNFTKAVQSQTEVLERIERTLESLFERELRESEKWLQSEQPEKRAKMGA